MVTDCQAVSVVSYRSVLGFDVCSSILCSGILADDAPSCSALHSLICSFLCWSCYLLAKWIVWCVCVICVCIMCVYVLCVLFCEFHCSLTA